MIRKPLRATVALAALLLGASRVDADVLAVQNGGNSVVRISDTGTVTQTFPANGLNSPIGITLNGNNGFPTVVNADSIVMYSPTGTPLGYYVPPSQSGVTLSGPVDIAFAPGLNNSINGFVTNQNGGAPYIGEYGPGGNFLGSFGTGTTGALPNLSVPTGIGYDPVSKELYIANSGNNTFTIYNPLNVANPVAVIQPTGLGALDGPQQIAFDSAGNVYIASFGTASTVASVQEYTAAGAYLRTFTVTGARSAGAEGVAVDPSGNVYVSLLNRGTIEKFSAAGVDLGPITTGLNGVAFLQYQAIPEPGSLALAGVALVGAAGYHLRRRGRRVAAAA